MNTCKLGGNVVSRPGLGCMNLSHAYGVPPSEADAIGVVRRAYELGVTHYDTAALYGFGRNETLMGKALKPFRREIHLASKCGMTGVDGKRVIDGRPETLKRTCDQALKRLQTDFIDLYYLHRWDRSVPLEDSIGAMADLKQAGKIGAIGLSEVSAETLLKANGIAPISAVQTEYSLWSRNAEIAVLDACRRLKITFVAFSPLARGFLTGSLPAPSDLPEKDIRRGMPRFQEPHYSANLAMLKEYLALADTAGCSPSQLALAWLLSRGEHVLPIPGTTSLSHLEENVTAPEVALSPGHLAALDALVNQNTVSGPRYPAPTQAEIDTEEFR